MANRPHAEHRGHVHDPDATHFHMVAGNLGRITDHILPVDQRNLRDIVRHQRIPPLDQRQHGLAFADAAFPLDDHPNPQNIDHRPHLRPPRGKHLLHGQRRQIDELHRNQRRAEHRHIHLLGNTQKILLRL